VDETCKYSAISLKNAICLERSAYTGGNAAGWGYHVYGIAANILYYYVMDYII